MVTINLLDETTRPKAPKIEGATRLHRAIGQRLAMIHRMHRQEIDGVRAMVDAIEADYAKAAELAEAVPELEMARNYRRFGAMCGRECQMLSFHHTSGTRRSFRICGEREAKGFAASSIALPRSTSSSMP